MLSDVFSLVISSIQSIFAVQGSLWDEIGVFPTFMLVFVSATFFRYIVLRMFGAGVAGASDSVISDRENSDSYVSSMQKGYSGGRWINSKYVR